MKICITCRILLPLASFTSDKSRRDGLQYRCKPCGKILHAAWYAASRDTVAAKTAAYVAANPEKVKADRAARYAATGDHVRAKSTKWYADNTEQAKASRAIWWAANPEKTKASSAAYRKANPEKIKSINAAWHKANPEKKRTYYHNREDRKRGNGGKLSPNLAAKLFKLQRGKCPCCGQPLGDSYHLDHIMPLKLGGSNTDDNIQLLRATCNNEKHTKHPGDFMRQRGFLL